VPVADATQWELAEQVADCAYPVFEQLEQLAAQGEVIFQDDSVLPAALRDALWFS
jgi:hypothetical protein